jgi:hypothetical protein
LLAFTLGLLLLGLAVLDLDLGAPFGVAFLTDFFAAPGILALFLWGALTRRGAAEA